MPSRHDPANSLADIIDNAERIERHLIGVDQPAFAGSGLLRDAVARCLEAAEARRALAQLHAGKD